MKSLSFMPMIEDLSADNIQKVRGFEAAVSHWTEGACAAEEWLNEVGECWGNAGSLMLRGGEALGFVVYAPLEHLPRAARYPVAPLGEEDVLLAYIEGDPRTRRHLLVRMLKDLRHRGVSRVESVSSDFGMPGHVPTKFLLENGWKPIGHFWQRGTPYTLARVEMGNTVEVGELARSLMGRVKLPALKRPHPAPGAFVRFTEEEKRLEVGTGGPRS